MNGGSNSSDSPASGLRNKPSNPPGLESVPPEAAAAACAVPEQIGKTRTAFHSLPLTQSAHSAVVAKVDMNVLDKIAAEC